MAEISGEISTEMKTDLGLQPAAESLNKKQWFSVMSKIPTEISTEISTEILANLPVKSLLRFKSVCKGWRDIIHEPRFIATQFSRANKSDPQPCFIFLPRPSERELIRNPLPSYHLVEQNPQHLRLFQSRNVEFKLRLLKNKGRILSTSCVNGLLCFSCLDFDYERIYTHIYNPATQESEELPDITAPPGVKPGDSLTSTLCFNVSTGEYKVVNLFNWGRSGPEAQVFVLGSNSWGKLENVPDVRRWRNSTASVHGSLHWLTPDYVLTFDLASETFGFIPYPQSTHFVKCEKILNLGGCLSVVHSPGASADSIELWIMMDYNVGESWKKFMVKTSPDCLPKAVDNVVPMSFKKEDGEILLLFDTNIVSYNIHTGEYTPHKVLHKKGERRSKSEVVYDVYPYIASLTSVKSLMEN